MFRRRLALAGLLFAGAPRFAAAILIAPPPAPPLPPPTGNVVTVSTVAALESAVALSFVGVGVVMVFSLSGAFVYAVRRSPAIDKDQA